MAGDLSTLASPTAPITDTEEGSTKVLSSDGGGGGGGEIIQMLSLPFLLLKLV